MSELDDRLSEGRDAVATMRPSADLWARVLERSDDGGVVLHDLSVAQAERRRRPLWFAVVAVAACLILVVALAAVLLEDRQPVDTVPPAESPTTECAPATQPRAITSGGQMKNRFAAPVASVATALALLGACGDDDTTPAEDTEAPTTIAEGEDLGFVGGAPGLSDQTMDISAVEEDGEVSGQARFTPANLTVDLQCADTATDGLVIVGGQAAERAESVAEPGEWVAVVILDGDPDHATLWFEGEADDYGSCQELLDAVPEDHHTYDSAIHAEVTGDIETG